MLQKGSWLYITDNTTVRWLQLFHLYKGFKRRSTTTGFFVKGSARIVEPPRVEYKGFKFKFNKKGDICRAIIVRTSYRAVKSDGMVTRFYTNTGLLIKKKQNLKSKYIQGPAPAHLARKRFKTVFKTII